MAAPDPTIYYLPGWETVTALDVLVFGDRQECDTFLARRNQCIALCDNVRNEIDAVTMLNYISGTGLLWGFHRLTETERGTVTDQARVNGIIPAYPTTLPIPNAIQTTMANAYNAAMAALPVTNHPRDQHDIFLANPPPSQRELFDFIYYGTIAGHS